MGRGAQHAFAKHTTAMAVTSTASGSWGNSPSKAQLQDGYRARCERLRVLRSVVDIFRLAVQQEGVDRTVGPSTLW
jgi:hypothetical protein